MRHFNRRKFLRLSLGSAGTILLSRCAMAQQTPKKLQNSLIKNYSSTDGLLDVELEASLQPINLERQQAYLMTYNGQFPGPKLEVKSGDTVRIHYKNNLSQPSNLNYHGLQSYTYTH